MTDFSMAIGRVRISHPIVQAPMAGVSTPALAAAVSNAGGLGSIGIGASSVDAARRMIEETHRQTSRPFNVNVFCHKPGQPDAERESAWLEYLMPLFEEVGAEPPISLASPYPSFVENEAMFEMLLEAQPAVVSFHFGLPRQDWIDALRASGITLMATATCLDEAFQIQKAGLHGIVAQGREAGGHSGVFDPATGGPELGTLPLVRLFSNYCRLPVLAAGGIMDGSGIRAALDLGAVGAQMGTAFILSPESSADEAYRARFRDGAAIETRLTPVISGRPARGFVDRWFEDVDSAAAIGIMPDYPIAYVAGKALKAAARQAGQHDFDACWAGQGAPLARSLPAGDLVQRLMEELKIASAVGR
ncbi:nitronate monooxygenase [Marinobacter halodurans]|uniref:Propionate 3-nitronate monooxygenase n=1 Tax=Marinobacter halodurans TaxID=2528979 RepID=A0ABY1ZU43_9GAMM|nr:nitronate monooxygenase [Marinobacter halodurans]TBW59604.1 nitronate monooxygenase [Marinobacter halodurans]